MRQRVHHTRLPVCIAHALNWLRSQVARHVTRMSNLLLFAVDCEEASDHVPDYDHAVEWATPQNVFGPLHEVFGFTVDVCASHGNAKCERYYTVNEDGLAQDWSSEVVWMNPPYARFVIDKWMRKAYESARDGGATVVCLIPSSTSTNWWHDYVERAEYRFVRGRIKFGGAKQSAMFSNAVVVFRPGVR